MKRLLVFVLALTFGAIALKAQGTAYINTETILNKMPEYIVAQQQLERMKNQYEAQFQAELNVIQDLFNQYQQERPRMNETQRMAKERDIITRERDLKERQREVFGENGVMFNNSKELLDPIRERLQVVIDAVAKQAGVALVIDITVLQGIVYRDPKADLTPLVLSKLKL